VEMALETNSVADEELLKLFQLFKEKGVLGDSENLLFKIRTYFDERFDFMEKETIL
jgi:hypothetical protein